MAKHRDTFNATTALATINRLRRVLLEEELICEEDFPFIFSTFLKRKYNNEVKLAISKKRKTLVVVYNGNKGLEQLDTPIGFTPEEKLLQLTLKLHKKIDDGIVDMTS